MPNTQAPLIAGGNIYANRFIEVTDEHTGTQADANAVIDGVAREGSTIIPIDGMTTATYVATDGKPLPIYGDGDICNIEAGAAFSAGDVLKSDSVGRAVVVATTGTTAQNGGAVALETSAGAGEFVRCTVTTRKTIRPAIA